jgi:hypothetical protein
MSKSKSRFMEHRIVANQTGNGKSGERRRSKPLTSHRVCDKEFV